MPVSNGKNTYREIKRACPLCSSARLAKHYQITKYKYKFQTSRCEACGFIFMNPALSDEAIKNLYGEEYYTGKSDYSYIDERKFFSHSKYVWDARIEFIARFKKSGNFLDVGSSFGGLLHSAEKYFIPYGIEMSEYSSGYSKNKFGDNIHTGTLADHKLDPESFSVITMIELAEHLEDPASAIEECHRLLEQGGLLVIQTANMDGLQAKFFKDNYAYYMPGHISYFTKKSLRMILKKTGFRKIKFYHPVEFGLMPKLLKSSHDFKSIWDYRAWIRISLYHLISKISIGDFAATSSMVVYAFK